MFESDNCYRNKRQKVQQDKRIQSHERERERQFANLTSGQGEPYLESAV